MGQVVLGPGVAGDLGRRCAVQLAATPGIDRVVAVDVLPPVRRRHLDARTRLALRLVTLERADRLADLTAAGVELVHGADDAAGAHLQLLARRSHRRPGTGVGR